MHQEHVCSYLEPERISCTLKSISLQTLRRHLSRVMGEVSYGKEAYIVESYGRPVAVLLSIDEYQRLQTITLGPEATPVRVRTPTWRTPFRPGTLNWT